MNGLNRKTDHERLTTVEVKQDYLEGAVEDIKFILERIESKFDTRMSHVETAVQTVSKDVADMKSRFRGGYWVLGALGAFAVGVAAVFRSITNH